MRFADLSVEGYLWYSQLWGWVVSASEIVVVVVASLAWRKWKASRNIVPLKNPNSILTHGSNWWKYELNRPTWSRKK